MLIYIWARPILIIVHTVEIPLHSPGWYCPLVLKTRLIGLITFSICSTFLAVIKPIIESRQQCFVRCASLFSPGNPVTFQRSEFFN